MESNGKRYERKTLVSDTTIKKVTKSLPSTFLTAISWMNFRLFDTLPRLKVYFLLIRLQSDSRSTSGQFQRSLQHPETRDDHDMVQKQFDCIAKYTLDLDCVSIERQDMSWWFQEPSEALLHKLSSLEMHRKHWLQCLIHDPQSADHSRQPQQSHLDWKRIHSLTLTKHFVFDGIVSRCEWKVSASSGKRTGWDVWNNWTC